MLKENQLTQKIELRKSFLALRSAISHERQAQASSLIFERLRERSGRFLTFYSVGSEIDLSSLNSFLMRSNRLIANRLEQGALVPYHLNSETDLVVSQLGILEPNPLRAKKALLSEIEWILVPAIAFDREGYRLGYGKGYYDKLLATTGDVRTVGVGLREQQSADLLPRDPWDIPVQEIILV